MEMENGLLYSLEFTGGQYRAGFYIGSAMTPSYFNIDEREYLKLRDRYAEFIDYWDGPPESQVIFYDAKAQVDYCTAWMDAEIERMRDNMNRAADAAFGVL